MSIVGCHGSCLFGAPFDVVGVEHGVAVHPGGAYLAAGSEHDDVLFRHIPQAGHQPWRLRRIEVAGRPRVPAGVVVANRSGAGDSGAGPRAGVC
jgi:hypothetical protein